MQESTMLKLTGITLEYLWDGYNIITDVLPSREPHPGPRPTEAWVKARQDLGLSTNAAAQVQYHTNHRKMHDLLHLGANHAKNGQAVEADDCFARAVALSDTLVRRVDPIPSDVVPEILAIWHLLVKEYGSQEQVDSILGEERCQ